MPACGIPSRQRTAPNASGKGHAMLTRFAIAVVVALFNLATAPTANASPYAVLHQDDSTLIDNALDVDRQRRSSGDRAQGRGGFDALPKRLSPDEQPGAA